MISIRTEGLAKKFGSQFALRDLNLQVGAGELFFLLGPSGCGKTTLLRCLAGFYAPDEGRIFFGDADVTGIPPHKRNTGMVFQSYALWPHLTVAENVAFGLEERKIAKPELKQRVGEALESVRMTAYAGRKPNQLSGGQQQRVALARALVVRPTCLLLDEPLSNLDARLRLEMRTEIRRICKAYNLTTVYVTHDQKEALSIADRMAILDAGRVAQVGAAREVYARPHTKIVANFIGETNFIEGRIAAVSGGRVTVECVAGIFTGVAGDPTAKPAVGMPVTLSIRPECWTLKDKREGEANVLKGKIGHAVYLGEAAQYDFQPAAGGLTLKVLELNPRWYGAGAAADVYAQVAPEDVVVLLQ